MSESERFLRKTRFIYNWPRALILLSILVAASEAPERYTRAPIQGIFWMIGKGTGAEAIAGPYGAIYITGDSDTELAAHEACHDARIQQEGALSFYSDYLFGGGCLEEIRCKITQHDVACQLPWMEKP